MTSVPDEIEKAVAALASDPAFASFAQPGVAVLAWDCDADRLLWCTPSAASLQPALADASGRVHRTVPARARLKALGAGLAPIQGVRFERLRLGRDRLGPPVTFACCLLRLESGEPVLLTAAVGRLSVHPVRLGPSVLGPSAPGPSAPGPSAPGPMASGRPVSADRLAALQARGTVRFVWQADAEARVTQVSPGLREVVGEAAARILGKTWPEILRTVASDPQGALAEIPDGRETWSGRDILWRIEGIPFDVPVELAGTPIYGPDRELIGFRGFGLCRTAELRERAAPGEPVALPGDETDPAEPVEPLNLPVRRPEARAAEPKPVAVPVLKSLSSEKPLAFEKPAVVAVLRSGGRDISVTGAGRENWFLGIRERVAARLGAPRTAAIRPGDMDEGRSGEAPSGSRRTAPRPALGPRLTGDERSAFHEIARALGARLEDEDTASGQPVTETAPGRSPLGASNGDLVLERLPAGVLVHRGDQVLFANRCLLDLTGYDDLDQLAGQGGLGRLFRETPEGPAARRSGAPLALAARDGASIPVEVSLTTMEWDGLPASLLLVRSLAEPLPARAEEAGRDERVRELEAILDTAADGVIVFDRAGQILSLNRSAETLFGTDRQAPAGQGITGLLAAESHRVAIECFEAMRDSQHARPRTEGREVLGRTRQGGTIPLHMCMGRLGDGPDAKICAVMRDMRASKKVERELLDAKRAAEEASAQKSDLLAKISHEIRTPLNAIIGFAEVMLEERFGALGNDRYKDYVKDVHASGTHVISLVNDLLDLAKIEAGRMEMAFESVNLNAVVATCVGLMQQQASRNRIIMRTSFAPKLPSVVADARSVRQIVLNLVSNAIKFTEPGGQVIVSTALTERGEAVLRVRDTGIGMTVKEIEAALEPFRQLATARRGDGTGLGLPLTKALVEANRAVLQISSTPRHGTLVEILFRPNRVLAQ